jgi:hypothetical protein
MKHRPPCIAHTSLSNTSAAATAAAAGIDMTYCSRTQRTTAWKWGSPWLRQLAAAAAACCHPIGRQPQQPVHPLSPALGPHHPCRHCCHPPCRCCCCCRRLRRPLLLRRCRACCWCLGGRPHPAHLAICAALPLCSTSRSKAHSCLKSGPSYGGGLQ